MSNLIKYVWELAIDERKGFMNYLFHIDLNLNENNEVNIYDRVWLVSNIWGKLDLEN